jgi:hypothetical protein
MDAFWPILASIVSALLLPIAAALGVLITKRIQLASADMSIKALQLKGDEHNQIKLVCDTAVSAAEQLYLSKKIMDTDRKPYAMKMASKMLTEKKITVQEDVLDTYIEAQVLILDDTNSTAPDTTSTAINPGVTAIPTAGLG